MSVGIASNFLDSSLVSSTATMRVVDLAKYGIEKRVELKPDPHVDVEMIEVFVSSEHLRCFGDQRRPVEYVAYDKRIAGGLPAGEIYWTYVIAPDGAIEVRDIFTIARCDGSEQYQQIHRVFNGNGILCREDVTVNGRLFLSRVHSYENLNETETLYDDHYNDEGGLLKRIVYCKNINNNSWCSYVTIYKNGNDSLERIEGSLMGPPILKGIPQINSLIDPPSIGLRGIDAVPYRRVD